MNSGLDDGIGKTGLPSCTITSKLQVNYRTTITQTIRNRVEWKYDNYGIKETTSGRVGRDVEQAGLTSMCCG